MEEYKKYFVYKYAHRQLLVDKDLEGILPSLGWVLQVDTFIKTIRYEIY